MQIDQEPRQPRKPDWYDYFGYIVAAAILIPISLWVRHEYSAPIAEWLESLFGG